MKLLMEVMEDVKNYGVLYHFKNISFSEQKERVKKIRTKFPGVEIISSIEKWPKGRFHSKGVIIIKKTSAYIIGNSHFLIFVNEKVLKDDNVFLNKKNVGDLDLWNSYFLKEFELFLLKKKDVLDKTGTTDQHNETIDNFKGDSKSTCHLWRTFFRSEKFAKIKPYFNHKKLKKYLISLIIGIIVFIIVGKEYLISLIIGIIASIIAGIILHHYLAK